MKGVSRSRGSKKELFENALKGLEEIVQRLESGDLALEDSLKLFEEGIRLTRVCSDRLEEAEKRIDILLRGKEGNLEVRSADPDSYEQKAGDAEGEGETR